MTINRWLVLCVLLLLAPAAQGQVKPEQAAARDFNAAAVLQNNGVYGRAELRWTEFVKKYPKHEKIDAAYDSLGVCQLHGKKYAEAAKTFESVLAKYGKYGQLDAVRYNLAMARLQLAAASQAAADYKRAAASFADVAAKHAGSKHAPKARYFQAEALYSSGDQAGAIAAYRQLLKDHAKSPLAADASYALGTTLQEQEQHEQAAQVFSQFLADKQRQQHELAREIELRLGISLHSLKKLPEAEARFAAAAQAANFPLADYALLQQGLCRMELGKPAEAAAILQQLPAKFPKSEYLAAAQLGAGKCCFLSDKLEDARKQLAAVAQGKGPEAPEAAYWLGRTLIKQDKPQEALKILEPAIAAHGGGPFAAQLQIGRIDALYELPDRRRETPPMYDAFAKKHAQHPLAAQAVYMAALASLGLEDYAAAQQYGETFLATAAFGDSELLPEVVYIAAEGALLAVANDKGGDLAKAEALYRRLTADHPQHARAPRAQVRVGWCLLHGQQHDPAVQHLTAALGGLKDPADVSEAQLLIGRAHSAAKRDKQAVAAYDASLKAKPDWPRRDEVLVAAAESQRALGDAAGATTRLRLLLSKLPDSSFAPQATCLLGQLAQQQGNPDEALKQFDAVIKKHAGSPYQAAALYGLAAAHFAKKSYPAALPPLDRLQAEHAQAEIAPQGLYLRGLVRQQAKQFDQAVKDFQAFLNTKPAGESALDASYAMALCQVELKQWPPAVARLQQLAKDNPDYQHADKVLYELGHALLGLDKPAEAVAAFRTLGEKRADSPLAAEGMFHVGRFHEQLADKSQPPAPAQLAQAEQAFAAGLTQAKDKPLREKLQYKLGDMQFRQQKFPAAAATLKLQLQEQPQGPLAGAARFLAGEALFRADKTAEALPLYVKVAADKVDKYHAQALYRAGVCAGRLKNWPESQKHFTALIQQFAKFPQISDARYGLGLALQSQNQLGPARQQYEQVTQETETEAAAKARFMIGEIAFAEKKYEEAVEHYLRVAVGYAYEEWQALAQFEAGRCFIELDQKPQAINALRTVVTKHPQHPKAKDAAELIKKLEQ